MINWSRSDFRWGWYWKCLLRIFLIRYLIWDWLLILRRNSLYFFCRTRLSCNFMLTLLFSFMMLQFDTYTFIFLFFLFLGWLLLYLLFLLPLIILEVDLFGEINPICMSFLSSFLFNKCSATTQIYLLIWIELSLYRCILLCLHIWSMYIYYSVLILKNNLRKCSIIPLIGFRMLAVFIWVGDRCLFICSMLCYKHLRTYQKHLVWVHVSDSLVVYIENSLQIGNVFPGFLHMFWKWRCWFSLKFAL